MSGDGFTPELRPLTKELLIKTVSEQRPKRILEIGTYKGGSGIAMLDNAHQNAVLDTVEIDPGRAAEALKNFRDAGYDSVLVDGRTFVEPSVFKVRIHAGDAKEILPRLEGIYDFVLLDGAKSSYTDFLGILDVIAKGGTVFADNVFYLGLVKGDSYPPHKHRTIVRNMRAYLKKVSDKSKYGTEFFEIEEGVAITEIL